MRKFAVLLLFCVLTLGVAGGATASPGIGSGPFVIGVTEDAPQGYDDGGLAMFKAMTGYGLTVDRMSVTWDPSAPTTISNQAALQRAITAATSAGVRVVLSVQPRHSTDVTGSNAYDAFAQFCVLVAKALPQVQDLIIGNEPNLQLFNNPSWQGTTPIGAYNYEHELASAYDALHAFNPNIDVIGLASSPRGNDSSATSNVGIPPVTFIWGMGQAYKASARSAPIADNLSFHPYPNPNSADDPPSKGYQWPNAGVPNLNRLEQAWWDAFNGTGQPLFQEDGPRKAAGLGSFVKWILDEAGWQVPTTLPGYVNQENWKTVSETTQAQYYAQLVSQYFGCDSPRVAALLYFHWIDEVDRAAGFQSGFARIDSSIRPAAAAVKAAFQAGCTAGQTTWKHSTQVDGATAGNWVSKSGFTFLVNANEDATFTATATPRKTNGKPIVVKGTMKAYLGSGVKFPGMVGGASNYTFTVVFKAALNPARSTTISQAPPKPAGTLLTELKAPFGYGRALAFDGKHLFASALNGQMLYELDQATGRTLGTVRMGWNEGNRHYCCVQPWAAAYAFGQLYVASLNFVFGTTNPSTVGESLASKLWAEPPWGCSDGSAVGINPVGFAVLGTGSYAFAGPLATCVVLSSRIGVNGIAARTSDFTVRNLGGMRISGLSDDGGGGLWVALATPSPSGTGNGRIVHYTTGGSAGTAIQLPGYLPTDLAYDATTFAPTCALWVNEARGSGTARIRAYAVPCG